VKYLTVIDIYDHIWNYQKNEVVGVYLGEELTFGVNNEKEE